jgi:hypothetical protein
MNKSYYEEQRKQNTSKKLGITRNQYSYIMRVGSILRQLYENDCNGFYDEATGKENTRRVIYNEMQEAKYEKTAKKFAKDNRLHLYIQGDCRGATIYLSKHKIPENNYTIASCIY